MSKGFTLIEIIVYVAIFSLMAVFAMGIVMQVGESVVRSRARVDLVNEADFLMGKIRWAMTGASEITEPAGTSTGARLAVSRFNYSQNPVVFAGADGSISISRAGAAAVRLNSQSVRVEGAEFTRVPATAISPESVRVSLYLIASSSDPKIQSSTTITSTFYIRQ